MVADRIKALRENLGMTQSELAHNLGITRSSVNAWEMGISVPSTQYISVPSTQYIVELSRILNVSADFLLGLHSSATLSLDGLTDQDIQVIHRIVDHLRAKNLSR